MSDSKAADMTELPEDEMSTEELLEAWEKGEPVELVRGSLEASPWLLSGTGSAAVVGSMTLTINFGYVDPRAWQNTIDSAHEATGSARLEELPQLQ